jgi:hypothetical protein
MIRIITSLLLLLAMVVLPCRSTARPEPQTNAPEKKTIAEEIDKLIAQLDSDRFEIREKAAARLEGLGENALPALAEAAKAGVSLEVRRRAEAITERIKIVVREKQIAQRIAEGRMLAVDQFLEQIVARKHKVVADRSPVAWKVPVGWAEGIADVAVKVSRRPIKVPVSDFASLFQDLPRVTELRPETYNLKNNRFTLSEIKKCYNFEHCVIAAGKIVGSYNFTNCVIIADSLSDTCNFEDCLVLCTKGLRGCHNMKRSILFVNGNMDSCYNYEDCIIYCDGDIVSCHNMARNVVLSTGTFQDSYNAQHTVFQVKTVKQGHNPERNVYVNLKEQDLDGLNAKENEFIQTQRGPLHVLRLFELREQGLEVTEDNGLRVSLLAEGKPFAAAGLKKGDLVLTVDQEKLATPEALRRLLRRKAAGDHTDVTVERAGTVHRFKVRF